MSQRGLLVIGGGPAAYAAVRGYRDAGGDGPVTVVSAEQVPPYHRPPLSKEYLRGEAGADELPLAEAGFWSGAGVELRLRTRASRLDVAAREVRLADGEVLPYDACVLATGAEPSRLPVPGADHPDVLVLRSLTDADRLRERAASARSAVVVGSGFIGCEAAASLALRGLAVTVVTDEPAPQAARLGAEVAARLAAWLGEAGVRLVTGAPVRRLVDGRRVFAATGDVVEADVVLVAGGIQPNVALAERAGLAVDQGRVLVDDAMASDAAGVWAAGDVALAHNAAAGRRLVVQHWGEAMAMGELAGRGAAGSPGSWAQAPGFWSDIGGRVLKQAAWGDGFDAVRLVDHGSGAFTAWYGRNGRLVGVLTHGADEDYERGRSLVERGGAGGSVTRSAR